MHSKRLIVAALLMTAAAPASAHVGGGHTSDFAAGFIHPLHGPDHVLAMVTLGLLASLLGGRALWAVPASFVAMMLAGGSLGLAGIPVPAVEFGILASIVVLGAIVAWGRSLPVGLAMALAGLFAVFHGHAHGSEMPLQASAATYALGFALASASLHGLGIAAGMAALGFPRMVRLAGAAAALAGVALAVS
jgi:urease accessory protein